LIDWTDTDKETVKAFADENEVSPAFSDNGTAAAASWLEFTRNTPRADWPEWLTTSKVTVVPFYDRSQLIGETLNTLDEALYQQVLVTIIVVIVMVMHLRTSLLISAMLPLAVLITFIAMKMAGVDANVVALSGIAIAIGTVVDVGIVLTENILKHLDEAPPDEAKSAVIYKAVTEVASAVTTSVATTVISFLPVFTMTGEAGRLFQPLAYTKSFALIASIIVALTIIPPVAHLLFGQVPRWLREKRTVSAALLAVAAVVSFFFSWILGLILLGLAVGIMLTPMVTGRPLRYALFTLNAAASLAVVLLLTSNWMPLGLDRNMIENLIFVVIVIGGLLVIFKLFEIIYPSVLRWCLAHKGMFLTIPVVLILLALSSWLGFAKTFSPLAALTGGSITETRIWQDAEETFPGLGREFRPALDEGSFLFMPTVSPHASIEESRELLGKMDRAIAAIPEVDRVVGKIGRVESPLDPAPISMVETVVNYLPEFKTDEKGRVLRFRTDDNEAFVYDKSGNLIADKGGKPFRQWRPEIRSPNDIWDKIAEAGTMPGVTGAPKLQPIETRLVMLRTGMRAPMGIKIKGATLEEIEKFGLEIESLLRSGEVKGLSVATVNADRIVGKPYLEITPNRDAASRYGLNIADIQETIQTAIGGRIVTTTVEGRERFAVQVRYAREKRDTEESLEKILVTSKEGAQVPLSQLAEIKYLRGPQVIKAEDTFLTGYVTFGSDQGFAEVDVVEAAKEFLEAKEASGDLIRPSGVRYQFAGNYESALEFNRNLMVMVPLCLGMIFILLYLDSRSVSSTLIVFSGVAVAWSGGFILLGLYGRPGFMDFELFGHNFRQLFQISPINLSTAVWVGFLALFGIATDDGVVISTYLRQRFAELKPQGVAAIREAVVDAGCRRVRPCLMTTATTLLALLPVLTSTGRGSDLMAPMAVPIFGGMLIELMTMFVVPVLYSLWSELTAKEPTTENLPNS
jgi:Cu(I)/Ag(I) efflux system membrane protein CusA/SilA